ncbi:hypothetical protein A4S06_08360 [Erysipelotrichaceae bacterium MTC7]|nr:hypothetical protein A4S06_08360 [Erysipelotrichaceae bacterium MTC7]
MHSENAIEVRNLYKDFKLTYDKPNTLKERIVNIGKSNTVRKTILKDISLDIKKGETVALVGVNGSGKSTLLKLMTKILYPNAGTLETQGKLTSLLELGAGFHPDFTGRENIYFNAAIFGLTRKEIDLRIDDIIAFAELGDFIDNPIRTYSSGMYMRLAFSIAINVDAEILLLDEILAVGDQHFQDKCYNHLKKLKKTGKTIVIVTHSLDVVKDICDRAVWIYKGELRLDGDPHYVISEYLTQLALDHKQELEKQIESGEAKVKGSVFLDAPTAFTKIQKGHGIAIQGWALSNAPEYKLVLTVDGKEYNDFTYEEREDVLRAFQDEYLGFVDPKKVGFKLIVEAEDLPRDVEEIKVEATLFDHKNNILSSKDVMVLQVAKGEQDATV